MAEIHPLRLYRLTNDVTLVDLAARVGCGHQHLSDIEKRRANPSFGLMRRLMDETGLSADDFFAQARPARANTEEE